MTGGVQYLVPIGFALWFISRAPKAPINACALPLIFSMGEAAFLQTYTMRLSVSTPFVHLNMNRDDLAMALLLGAWLYVRWQRPRTSASLGIETLLAGLVCLGLSLQLVAAWVDIGALNPGNLSGAAFGARPYFFLPLGFLVWVDVFRRTSRDEFWAFAGRLSLMTVLLMIPYTLSAVGARVYTETPYARYEVGSGTVVRDFLTFPLLTKLALAYYLVRMVTVGVTPGRFAAVALLISGISLSLTRSYLLPTVLIFAIVTIYALLRGPTDRKLAVPATLLSALAAAAIFLSYFAGPNLHVLSTRVDTLRHSTLQDANLQSRLQHFEKASHYIAKVDAVNGLGFIGTGTRSVTNTGIVYWGDFMWSSVLVYMGFAGIACLGALLIFGVVKAALLAFGRDREASAIGILVLLMLVWEASRTFASEGYLWFFANAMLSFAILACEARKMWWRGPTPAPSAAPG